MPELYAPHKRLIQHRLKHTEVHTYDASHAIQLYIMLTAWCFRLEHCAASLLLQHEFITHLDLFILIANLSLMGNCRGILS